MLGVAAALRLVDDVLLPNNVALDHRQFLAYIPAAPATTAALFDAVVGAWSFSGESWQEAGAAVAAENAALDWLRGLAGLPSTAAGCFVSGGRRATSAGWPSPATSGGVGTPVPGGWPWRARRRRTRRSAARPRCSTSTSSRSPATSATGSPGPGCATRSSGRSVCAVVASAGATNTGAVDELDAVADVCGGVGAWLHVDAAYGGAALCLPELAGRFAGIERADSLVIDPHKWLFAPLDCAALLYRDPVGAARTHRQSASYLDAFGDDHVNPSDLAFHLTRRTRGLPLWFALVVHGTDAYTTAVRAGVELARTAAAMIAAMGEPVRLIMEPELSVVLFERDGWARADWDAWAAAALADGLAFVTPTRWRGRDVGRLAFLHPDTDLAAVAALLARLP